jgi:hypothetical protein
MSLAGFVFVSTIPALAVGVLIALFVLFREQSGGATKRAKRFLLSNWN